MAISSQFENRQFNAAYLNLEPKLINASLLTFEKHLQSIGSFRLEEVSAFNEINADCDLGIIDAQNLVGETLPAWLKSMERSLKGKNIIWVPCLVICKFDFSLAKELMNQAALCNWYFDLIRPEDFPTVPLRAANLIRIHDHLKEIQRYDSLLDQLQQKTIHLESELAMMKGRKN